MPKHPVPISAARFMMIDLPGSQLSSPQKEFLLRYPFRGVCLFRRNIESAEQVRTLIADIRQVLGDDALIAIDQEGGAVMRATFLPDAPSAMSLGVANNPALSEQVGLAVGRGLADLGININFAPVLDVNCNPANPVIAERSFGNNVDLVINHAAAWAKGLMLAGVASCGKHFPGHGDTSVDSHLALPSINKSLAQLNAVELAPFKALANTLPMIMSAHVCYQQIDQEYPATLSKLLINGLLREQLNFQGVVVTDALNMHAVSKKYGQGKAAALALKAGIDLTLVIGSSEEIIAAHNSINQAITDQPSEFALLEQADQRLSRLAKMFPYLPQYRYNEISADQQLMQYAWRCGIARLGLPTDWQGISPGTPLRLVACKAFTGDGISEAGVSVHHLARYLEVKYPLSIVEFDSVEQIYSSSLPQDQHLNILVSLTRKRYPQALKNTDFNLHLVLWNPYCALDSDIPSILSFGLTASALEAMAMAISGELNMSEFLF